MHAPPWTHQRAPLPGARALSGCCKHTSKVSSWDSSLCCRETPLSTTVFLSLSLFPPPWRRRILPPLSSVEGGKLRQLTLLAHLGSRSSPLRTSELGAFCKRRSASAIERHTRTRVHLFIYLQEEAARVSRPYPPPFLPPPLAAAPSGASSWAGGEGGEAPGLDQARQGKGRKGAQRGWANRCAPRSIGQTWLAGRLVGSLALGGGAGRESLLLLVLLLLLHVLRVARDWEPGGGEGATPRSSTWGGGRPLHFPPPPRFSLCG